MLIIISSSTSITLETESAGFHLDVTLLGSGGFNVFSREHIIQMRTDAYASLCYSLFLAYEIWLKENRLVGEG